MIYIVEMTSRSKLSSTEIVAPVVPVLEGSVGDMTHMGFHAMGAGMGACPMAPAVVRHVSPRWCESTIAAAAWLKVALLLLLRMLVLLRMIRLHLLWGRIIRIHGRRIVVLSHVLPIGWLLVATTAATATTSSIVVVTPTSSSATISTTAVRAKIRETAWCTGGEMLWFELWWHMLCRR